jgi:hypothetical protein
VSENAKKCQKNVSEGSEFQVSLFGWSRTKGEFQWRREEMAIRFTPFTPSPNPSHFSRGFSPSCGVQLRHVFGIISIF